MSDKKVNVLVYSGNGSTIDSVRHCLWSLRRLLSPNYAVISVSGEAILREPWTATCALLVMPGGADLGYCRILDGEGNRKISQYVNKGGAYLGLCAGGYYGSGRCEFEEGRRGMEVMGDRELAFFPGTCRGLAYPGFVYHSEIGTRAAEIRVNKEALSTTSSTISDSLHVYYNGGGVFVDASNFKNRGVEVLAEFVDHPQVDSGEGSAAVVYCRVGQGGAVLTSPHPEFAAINLSKGDENPEYPAIIKKLAADDKERTDFMKACLTKLGLRVNNEDNSVPSLSRLHLSSIEPSDIAKLVSSWSDIVIEENGERLIKGENDTFRLERLSTMIVQSLVDDLPVAKATPAPSDEIVDYDKVIKRMVLHDNALPDSKETPYFNHYAFFASLERFNNESKASKGDFGRHLLYGEVVTSTNTLLEKNPSLLALLPQGLTATATTQVAGRGRGSNVWVSPPGSLMFSTVIWHPLSLSQSAPVVFIQYIAALAIVAGIRNYDKGYGRLPVKLKWPNDIYALDPSRSQQHPRISSPARTDYVKIGGILVNSSYSGGDYTLVAGVGINVSNAAPTTSLNALASHAGLPPLTLEKLLASILVQFEALHARFCREGFSKFFEETYYASWLHSEQIVTLEAEGGVRARIRGITSDWGQLKAEELGWEDRPTGRVFELQTDSNSFDFFKGLLKKKTT